MRDMVVAFFHPFILYMYSVAGNVGDDVKFIDPLLPVYWTNNIFVFVRNNFYNWLNNIGGVEFEKDFLWNLCCQWLKELDGCIQEEHFNIQIIIANAINMMLYQSSVT